MTTYQQGRLDAAAAVEHEHSLWIDPSEDETDAFSAAAHAALHGTPHRERALTVATEWRVQCVRDDGAATFDETFTGPDAEMMAAEFRRLETGPAGRWRVTHRTVWAEAWEEQK